MSLSSSQDKEQIINKSFCTHTMKVVGADNEGRQNADQVAQKNRSHLPSLWIDLNQARSDLPRLSSLALSSTSYQAPFSSPSACTAHFGLKLAWSDPACSWSSPPSWSDPLVWSSPLGTSSADGQCPRNSACAVRLETCVLLQEHLCPLTSASEDPAVAVHWSQSQANSQRLLVQNSDWKKSEQFSETLRLRFLQHWRFFGILGRPSKVLSWKTQYYTFVCENALLLENDKYQVFKKRAVRMLSS